MAISNILPPDDPSSFDQTGTSSDESSSSSTSFPGIDCPAVLLDGDGIDEDDAGSFQEVAGAKKRPRSPPRPPASLRSPPFRRRRSSDARSHARCEDPSADARSLSRLSRHLVSLRALIPPAARSGKDGNVLADALKYKKALSNEIEILRRAFPYAKQVNVQRIGTGSLQIQILSEKRKGLLVALMEAIESSGVVLANVNVSCRSGKIRINAISTIDNSQSTVSLKVILMATIMRFDSDLGYECC